MRWLGGFPGPLRRPQKGGSGVDLPGPALPLSINPVLGLSVSVVSSLFFFFFLAKIFCKGPGNWGGERVGQGGMPPSPLRQVV